MDEGSPAKPILAGVSLVTAGAMAANIASYLLHLPASRWLGPEGYGEFASLLAAQLIIAVPALALQMVIAREVVGGRLRGRDVTASLRTLGRRCAGVVTVVAAALIVPLSLLLDTSVASTAAALLTAPMLVLLATEQGILQGRQQFGALAVLLAGAGVAKVAPAVVVLAAGGGPAGALVAGALGTAGAAAAGWVLSRQGSGSVVGVASGVGVASVVRASQVQLVLVGLTSLDLVLARALLDGEQAGIYALGAVAAKMAFWLPQAIGVVLYPRMANPEHSRRAVRHALLVLLGVGGLVVVGAAVCAPVVPALVGEQYTAVTGVLWLFALQGSVLAVLQGALISAIARDATRISAIAWLGLAAEALLLVFLGRSVTGFVLVAVACAGAVTVVVVAVALRSAGRPTVVSVPV